VPTIIQNVTNWHDKWLSYCCFILADLNNLADLQRCSSHVRSSRDKANEKNAARSVRVREDGVAVAPEHARTS
jgi:hypothetical protein